MFNKMYFPNFQHELFHLQSQQITLMVDLDCQRSRELLTMVCLYRKIILLPILK